MAKIRKVNRCADCGRESWKWWKFQVCHFHKIVVCEPCADRHWECEPEKDKIEDIKWRRRW